MEAEICGEAIKIRSLDHSWPWKEQKTILDISVLQKASISDALAFGPTQLIGRLRDSTAASREGPLLLSVYAID